MIDSDWSEAPGHTPGLSLRHQNSPVGQEGDLIGRHLEFQGVCWYNQYTDVGDEGVG